MKRMKWLAMGATLLGVLVLAVPQAGASVTGAIAFECTANLASGFPGSGNGTCNGTGVGLGAGVTGSVGTTPYALVGAGAFTSNFNYVEPCPAPSVPPLLGTAAGTANVAGATAVVGTTPTTANLTTQFQWTRVGLTAVILTSNTTVTFGTGATATEVSPNDVALAAFAPILTAPTAHLCPAGDPLTAIVAGVDVSPA